MHRGMPIRDESPQTLRNRFGMCRYTMPSQVLFVRHLGCADSQTPRTCTFSSYLNFNPCNTCNPTAAISSSLCRYHKTGKGRYHDSIAKRAAFLVAPLPARAPRSAANAAHPNRFRMNVCSPSLANPCRMNVCVMTPGVPPSRVSDLDRSKRRGSYGAEIWIGRFAQVEEISKDRGT